MKTCLLKCRMLLGVVAFCTFFGLLYPEITFLPETYRVLDETGEDITDTISAQELLDYLIQQKPKKTKVKYTGRGWKSFFSARKLSGK